MLEGVNQIEDTWVQQLCATFSLGKCARWKTTGGTRNVAVIVVAESGKFLARQRFAEYCNPERIAFDHAVAAYLAERDCPVVAPCKSATGDCCWRDEDRLWELFPFVEGRPMHTEDEADLAALGEALARLHKVGRDFPDHLEKLGPRGETDPDDLLTKCGELAAVSENCAQAVAGYPPWIKAALEILPNERYAQLPKTLIHGDIQPGNVLFNDAGVAAFVDLDWACFAPRIYDLGFAIPFCCASHVEPVDPADIWSLTQPLVVRNNLMNAFMQAYLMEDDAFTFEESNVLPAQMLLSWCHARIFGAYKVPEKHRAAFLARPPYTYDEILGGFAAQWGKKR